MTTPDPQDQGPDRCDATHPATGEMCEAYAGHDEHWFGLGETWRTPATKTVADQIRTALLDGLDQLDRDEYRRVSPGDVADLIERVAREVGRA